MNGKYGNDGVGVALKSILEKYAYVPFGKSSFLIYLPSVSYTHLRAHET